MAVDELCRASGLDRAQVDELISQGVLMPLDLPDGRQVFRDEDLAIARSALTRLCNKACSGAIHVWGKRRTVKCRTRMVASAAS